MSWIAVGSAAAVVVGSLIQSDSTDKAAAKQEQATQKGLDEQSRQFNIIQKNQAPYLEGGRLGMSDLMARLGYFPAPPSGAKSYQDVANPIYARYAQSFGAKDLTSVRPGTIPVDKWEEMTADQRQALWANMPEAQRNEELFKTVSPEYRNRAYREAEQGWQDVQSGNTANYGSLNKKFSIEDFWSDPVTQLSYQSGLDLGTKAIRNAAPLTTGLDSGAAIKEMVKFGTDYSGSKAGESYARFEGDKTNVFNRLAAMAGIGQTANSVTAQAGMNAANANSGMLTAQGNAAAAASIARGNQQAGGLSNIANWWNQRYMVDQFNQNRRPGSTGYDSGYYQTNAPS